MLKYYANLKKALQAIVFIVFSFCIFAAKAQGGGSYDRFWTAVQRDNPGVIARLHARGFDLNTPSPQLTPALVQALYLDNLRVADYLIGHPQTDVNAANAANETPLMMASIRGHSDLVDRLLDRQAQVNQPGWAPLHYAAASPLPASVTITHRLLEQHAFINATSPNGTTPLMMAAQYGREEVLALLLEEGAEPLLRNEQGLTALDFARQSGRQHMVDRLALFVRSHQASPGW